MSKKLRKSDLMFMNDGLLSGCAVENNIQLNNNTKQIICKKKNPIVKFNQIAKKRIKLNDSYQIKLEKYTKSIQKVIKCSSEIFKTNNDEQINKYLNNILTYSKELSVK